MENPFDLLVFDLKSLIKKIGHVAIWYIPLNFRTTQEGTFDRIAKRHLRLLQNKKDTGLLRDKKFTMFLLFLKIVYNNNIDNNC